MPGPTPETAVHIRPYGSGEYYTGYGLEVNAMVELTPDVVERFMDVLSIETAPWSSDTSPWYIAMEPVATGVVKKLAELQDTGEIDLSCRKNAAKNCGAHVSHILAGSFLPDRGSVINMATIHLSCEDALMRTVPSNRASAAPEIVENAPRGTHLDIGCHTQLGMIAELAGKLMVEELEALEAAKLA